MQREGIDVDVSMLPSAEDFIPYLRPNVATMAHASDGFHFHSRHTLPGGVNSLAMVPLAVGALLPAVQGARGVAQQNKELNYMKQIAPTFHMYADVHGRFPADIYDQEGKPLLSWRVRLLPYLDQQAVYEQFHLDEPWDSPHNRKLAAVVPVYASPTIAIASPEMTCYLALAGPETLWPGN